MKIISISLLSFFCLTGLCPDASGQVSGQLTTAFGQPIAMANILLLNSSDSAQAKATVSNEKGIYRIDNIGRGAYFLRVSSIGYQTWQSPSFSLSDSLSVKDFGVLVLQENSRQLGEVVVRADRPLLQQQPDKTVVNVENSLLSKGSSALEVLERSPGISIDHRNNNFMLAGKSGVTVMINGSLLHMPIEQVFAFLNSMSADDIEKIELLTTPPARYDADGSAGMINIVLKKNKKRGTNGTLSLTGGYGWREKATASAHLAHNTAKTSLYGSYTFSHDRSYSDMYITSSQNMPFMGGNMNVVVWDTTHRRQDNHDATLGIDHTLNAKTAIGGSLNYNSSHGFSSTANHATYHILPDSLLFFDGSVNGTSRWRNLVSSLYLERKMRAGERINLAADYLYFNNQGPSDVHSSFLSKDGMEAVANDTLFAPSQRGYANTVIRVGVGKVDYSKQIGKKATIETGLKGSYTRSTSQSGIESLVNGVWIIGRSETANDIVMKEGIGAAYVSLDAQLSASTTLAVGARYEYSHTRMDNPSTDKHTVDRKLGSLFPTLLLSGKLSDRSNWQLSYNKRISRPSYNDLASYVGYSDPSAVYTGNPFLQPTITHAIKLGYNYRPYSFSILFSRDLNPIARYQITESPLKDVLYISPQNLAWQNNLGFQINLPGKINGWWNMNYNLTGNWRQFKENYTPQPVEAAYFAWSLTASQTFALPHNFSAEISGWYNSRGYNGTVKVAGFGALNAGIKKELNNNKGSFQLSVSDLLRTVRVNTYYGTLTEEAFSIKNHVFIHTESARSPIIKLTYSRSFGSTPIRSQNRQGNGPEDERNRIRKD